MKKLLYAILLMLTFILSPVIQAQNISNNAEMQELVLSVSSEKLNVNAGGIFVEYQGQRLPVQALFKDGQQWVVQIRVGLYTCPNGHSRICSYCGGCGFPTCVYYCNGACF